MHSFLFHDVLGFIFCIYCTNLTGYWTFTLKEIATYYYPLGFEKTESSLMMAIDSPYRLKSLSRIGLDNIRIQVQIDEVVFTIYVIL